MAISDRKVPEMNMPETETTAADEEVRTDITEVGKGADEDE